ncbi:unnamed protein product [Cladocopium goreaui]|uniref:Apple domain-containing protein n=1 Tax=Cladocopium goreaui TaxID=2562237 RepID=A0A9P1CHY3_9DINO|nr:unnamed protein product [Cladocopium goreaui]
MMALRAVAWITLLPRLLAEECSAESCAPRNTGSTFLQFTSRVRHSENSEKQVSCAPFSEWPDVDGVTCGGCRALVKTSSFKRCKDYCESFGHSCVAAAEEEDENCAVKEDYDCDEEIDDTSDMLCTCSKTPAAPCYSSLDGVVTDEGQSVGMARTSSMDECEKACNDKESCESFTLCPEWQKCFLKAKSLDGSEAVEQKSDCKSVFKTTCGSTGGGGGSSGGGSSGGSSGGSGELKVKVVSYNLYWWNAFDQNSWKSDGIISNIKENLRPDTIGFQECDSPSQISRRTGFLSEASQFKGAQGVMIREGRFRASNKGSRDLEATGKWGPRYVTWVKLTDESGKSFWHFNTHWCVHSEGKRVCNEDVRYRGARNMVRAIRDVAGDSPVLITGDFNARMNEKGPQHFLDSGFKLAVNDWVDCIFYSNHWTLLREGKGSSSGSDHKPVYAELALN